MPDLIPLRTNGFDPRPTTPAVNPTERIDFVWVHDLEVKDVQVLESLASDHRVIVVELTWE